MKFTAAIGVAALFMAPSAAAWKLPVSIYAKNPQIDLVLCWHCLPSTPTRLTLPLLPALLPVASLAVSHLEPQLGPLLDSHPEPPLSLHPEPHLALQLDSQLDGLPRLDSLLAVEHLVTDLVLRDLATADPATEGSAMEVTVMDPSPPASPPSLLLALLSALLPPCLLDSPSLPVSHLGSPVASLVARPLAVHSPFCLSRPRPLLQLVSRETSLVTTPVRCSRFCTLQLRSCNMWDRLLLCFLWLLDQLERRDCCYIGMFSLVSCRVVILSICENIA